MDEVIVAVAGSGQTHGDIRLPAIFADNMILQREMPVPIWGTAKPGEIVTVVTEFELLALGLSS